MHSDPLADMLTRIRNAQAARRPEVWLPYSKLKMAVLDLLAKEGWVVKVERVPAQTVKPSRSMKKRDIVRNRFDQIKVTLVYKDGTKPLISSVKRISKPGKRVYVSKDAIPRVLNRMGMAVLSTSQGVMTDTQARKKGVGGEVICEIY